MEASLSRTPWSSDKFGGGFNNKVLLGACATFSAYNIFNKINDEQAKRSQKLVARLLQRAQQARERENEN